MEFPGLEKSLSTIIKQVIGPAYSMYNVFGDVKAGKTLLAVETWKLAKDKGYRVLIVDAEQERDGISAYHQEPYNLPANTVARCRNWDEWSQFLVYIKKSDPKEWDKTIIFVDPFSQIMQMKLNKLAEDNGGDDFLKRTKKVTNKTEREINAYTEYTESMISMIQILKSKFEFVVLNSHYNYEKVGSNDNSILRMQLDYFGKGRGIITQKSDANIYLGKDSNGKYYVNKLPLGKAVLGLEFGTTHNPSLKAVDDVFQLAEHIMETVENQHPYYEELYKTK